MRRWILCYPMEREKVISSNIAAVGYLDDSNSLEVEFTNGSVYRYSGVPDQVYRDLLKANSIGKFFNINIKNKFSFEKV